MGTNGWRGSGGRGRDRDEAGVNAAGVFLGSLSGAVPDRAGLNGAECMIDVELPAEGKFQGYDLERETRPVRHLALRRRWEPRPRTMKQGTSNAFYLLGLVLLFYGVKISRVLEIAVANSSPMSDPQRGLLWIGCGVLGIVIGLLGAVLRRH